MHKHEHKTDKRRKSCGDDISVNLHTAYANFAMFSHRVTLIPCVF